MRRVLTLPAVALAMWGFQAVVSLTPEPATQSQAVVLAPPETELMVTSFYGEPYHGRKTASGEVFDQEAMTAAHRSLPFGTLLHCEVAGRSVVVRVTDRGPFHPQRDLDISRGAARKLGMLQAGVAVLNVRRIE